MSRKIRERAIPKYKKDWPGKTLLMKEDCPTTRMSVSYTHLTLPTT